MISANIDETQDLFPVITHMFQNVHGSMVYLVSSHEISIRELL